MSLLPDMLRRLEPGQAWWMLRRRLVANLLDLDGVGEGFGVLGG